MSGSATTVATWPLRETSSAPARQTLQIVPIANGEDGVFADDSRRLVDLADIQPGGKYYSIAKLQIRYERQTPDDSRYAQATGWLVRPDLLVTTSYCAFNHTDGLGRAIEVKVFIGYNGKSSPGIQFRSGQKIAVSNEWVSSSSSEANNVSFIQVDTPFSDVIPITYQPTPTRGSLKLGVVGYPGDHVSNDERGAQMYEAYVDTIFDLRNAESHMLEHKISAYADQTGGPVLIQAQNVSIGTHIGVGQTKNLASVIKGSFGNDYQEYIDALTSSSQAAVIGGSEAIIDVQVRGVVPETNTAEELTTFNDDEEFWDAFRKVEKIGVTIPANTLERVAPFLGPIGSPIAAVIGSVIGNIDKLDQISDAGNNMTPTEFGWQSHAGRAILAEAALQTVMSMKHDEISKYDIMDNMKKTYDGSKDAIRPVAALLQTPIIDLTSQMTASSSSGELQTTSYPTLSTSVTSLSILSSKQEAFVTGLEEAARGSDFGGSFVEFASSISQIGLTVPPPSESIAGNADLLLSNRTFSPSDLTSFENSQQVQTLVQRAFMGEAALQAIQNISADDMKTSGFFDKMLDGVQNIGAEVIRHAPTVIKVIAPALV